MAKTKRTNVQRLRIEILMAITDYFYENENRCITTEEINKMSKEDILYYYLAWEGIYGYTSYIINIFEGK